MHLILTPCRPRVKGINGGHVHRKIPPGRPLPAAHSPLPSSSLRPPNPPNRTFGHGAMWQSSNMYTMSGMLGTLGARPYN